MTNWISNSDFISVNFNQHTHTHTHNRIPQTLYRETVRSYGRSPLQAYRFDHPLEGITGVELDTAISRLVSKRCQGPDGIVQSIIKLFGRRTRLFYLHAFNCSLRTGCIPEV